MAEWIGIDPGIGGGIARICENGLAQAWPMPETEREVYELIVDIKKIDSFALIERVHAWPAVQERNGQKITRGIKSTFTFAQGYGFLRGLLIGSEIPFDQVSPKKWQAFMGCLTGGKKAISKSKAQQLFPYVKITHRTADALLIAEYCRRIRTGIGKPIEADPYDSL